MASLAAINLGAGRTAVAVTTGNAHTCAILDNDDLKCWGKGGYGRLGYDSNDNKGNSAGDIIYGKPRRGISGREPHGRRRVGRLLPHVWHPRRRRTQVLGVRLARQPRLRLDGLHGRFGRRDGEPQCGQPGVGGGRLCPQPALPATAFAAATLAVTASALATTAHALAAATATLAVAATSRTASVSARAAAAAAASLAGAVAATNATHATVAGRPCPPRTRHSLPTSRRPAWTRAPTPRAAAKLSSSSRSPSSSSSLPLQQPLRSSSSRRKRRSRRSPPPNSNDQQA